MTQFAGNFTGVCGFTLLSGGLGGGIAGLIVIFLLGIFAGLLKVGIAKLGCLSSFCVGVGFFMLVASSTIMSTLAASSGSGTVGWLGFPIALVGLGLIIVPIALKIFNKKD